LTFKAKFFPFGPILAAGVFLVIIIGNVWYMTPWGAGDGFSAIGFAGTFGIIPVLILIYVGYKFIKKTKLVPLTECDFSMPAAYAVDKSE
jgi:lysine-specific permease